MSSQPESWTEEERRVFGDRRQPEYVPMSPEEETRVFRSIAKYNSRENLKAYEEALKPTLSDAACRRLARAILNIEEPPERGE